MTANDKYRPRGNIRYLNEMVNTLAAGEALSDEEWDAIAEPIKAIATNYNTAVAEHEGQARSSAARSREKNDARHHHVKGQLKRIEDACNELAASFDEAHPFTLQVLSGQTSVFVPGRVQHIREVCGPHALARQYHIPFAPNPNTMEEVHEFQAGDPGWEKLRQYAEHLNWTHGALALGLIVHARLQDFEEGFREDQARDRSRTDVGTTGTLVPSERGLAELRTEAGRQQRRRKTAVPNMRRDQGGRENLSDEVYGAPKWALARDCYGLLHEQGLSESFSAAGDGTLVTFACNMHAFATGIDPVPQRGNGGYGHLAAKAAKIMGAWFEHTRWLKDAGRGRTPLDEEFYVRWASLQAAHRTGRVPLWLK